MRNEHLIDLHTNALRAMRCAVIVITPEDIQCLTEEGDDDQSPYTIEQIEDWMELHGDDLEEALLGEYWGETVRDVIDHKPIVEEPAHV